MNKDELNIKIENLLLEHNKIQSLLDILTKLQEGKIIQVNTPLGWRDCDESCKYDLDPSYYRIKPEFEYIPFSLENSEELIGRVVKCKHNTNIYLIVSVFENGVVLGNGERANYRNLYENFIFLDESVCGKQRLK